MIARIWAYWIVVVIIAVLASGCTSQQAARMVAPSGKLSTDSAGPESQLAQQNKQPVLDENPDLSDYLAYAALNNPGLEAVFNQYKAALQRVPQVRALPDPRFTYRYFIQEIETRVGPQRQAFRLAQTFPWLAKLKAKGNIAQEEANIVRARYQEAKLELFYKTTRAFAEYYYLANAVEIVRKNRDLIKYLEQVARARYTTAQAAHADVIRAQVQLGKLDDQLQQLIDLRGPMVAELNAVMNRPINQQLPWPRRLPADEIDISDEKILSLYRQQNPKLKALAHQVSREKHSMELAKTAYFPDITLSADYIDVSDAVRMPGQGLGAPFAQRSLTRLAGGAGDLLDVATIPRSFLPGPAPSDSGKDAWMVGISLNLPIWYDKYRAGEREALLRYYAALHAKAEADNRLAAKIRLAIYQFRDAKRRIDLYGQTLIPKAQEALKSIEAAFRVGSTTFLDLIEAEQILLEFQLARQRALADRTQRLAELDMLTGQQLPRKQPDEQKATP